MRRLASLVIAACLALTAGTAAASGPKEDLVSGTVQGLFATGVGSFSSHVHVNARGNAAAARGQSWGRFFDTPLGDVLIEGSVFCVRADGNQAVVGVIVEQSNTAFVPPGTVALRWVVDNGEGRNDPPDQTATLTLFPPPPTCPPPTLAPIELGPVQQGNFVVKDVG